MPTQPLGWFKKPITKAEDFKGLKFRTVGISIDVFTGLGAAVNALPGGEIVPAMDRGLLDAAEFNNATSDRILGFPDVSKVCMLQSFHQNAEQFEIMFNKTKYDALPAKMRAIIENAVEAASADMSWKAIDRYSKDYIEMQTEAERQVLQDARRGAADAARRSTTQAAAKKAADNPLFKEIEESQKAFAERAVRWDLDTNVNRRMAYNHYFGQKPRRRRRRPDADADVTRHHPAMPGWCFFCRRLASTRRRRRLARAMQKLLLFVDKVSTWVGQAFSWLIVALTLLDHLGSVLPLRARRTRTRGRST